MNHSLRPRIAIYTLLIPVYAGAAIAESQPAAKDWPQFRGPCRDGRSKETGLLTTWPKDGPPLAWRVEGLGNGYSSVSIAGDKIFTMGDRKKSQFVIALDLPTHKEVWATPISAEWKDGGARCTPTIDGERVYAIGAHGDLVCLATKTGDILWRKSLPKDFGGKMMSGWGYSESPLVDGEKLVCTPGGPDAAIVALDKKTGQLLWKARLPNLGPNGRDGAGYSSMVVSNACGTRQYVQSLGRGTVGVSADDGRFLWGYNRTANSTAVICTPIVTGNFVFSTTSYKTGSALLQLVPGKAKGSIEAKEVYYLDQNIFENHHGGLVLVDGYLYGGKGQNSGFPTCIELKTGKIMWNDRGPGSGSAAVIYADGHLYFRYQDGIMALIEATPKSLQVTSTFKLPTSGSPSWPHPAICDGMLYLRHQDTLLCYDIREPARNGCAQSGMPF